MISVDARCHISENMRLPKMESCRWPPAMRPQGICVLREWLTGTIKQSFPSSIQSGRTDVIDYGKQSPYRRTTRPKNRVNPRFSRDGSSTNRSTNRQNRRALLAVRDRSNVTTSTGKEPRGVSEAPRNSNASVLGDRPTFRTPIGRVARRSRPCRATGSNKRTSAVCVA